MNRPTFITMSTLVFTIVAYCALTQVAQADIGFALDSRGLTPEAVGTAIAPLRLLSIDSGASMRR